MEDQIVAADRRLRVQVFVASLLLLAAGVFLLWLLEQQLEEVRRLSGRDLQEAARRMVRLVAIIVSVSGAGFLGVGLWLGRVGRQVRRSGRFPPPGMRVVKDTPVRTGKPVRLLANLALAGAAILALGGPLGAWFFYRWAAGLLGL